jgi:ABC-type transport system involved in multi-copper enzyme maturation permease subunit
MIIRALALNTLGTLLRNKIVVLFCAVFLCLLMLMLTPLLQVRSMANAMSPTQSQGMVVSMVAGIAGLASGFGSLLAAYCAADSVFSEIKSGTILAVLARPVRRWEFLFGRYLGVQLLMVIYVTFMLALSYALAWLGGEPLFGSPWPLVIYPLVRYAFYSAMAILFVTAMHPVSAFALVLVVEVLASMVAPGSFAAHSLPAWLANGTYYVLPSTGLLSETRFLAVTQSSLAATPWTEHLTALAYGLDYALVLFLLAVWSFSKRSLSRL